MRNGMNFLTIPMDTAPGGESGLSPQSEKTVRPFSNLLREKMASYPNTMPEAGGWTLQMNCPLILSDRFVLQLKRKILKIY